jgi:hypothetical protein
MKGPGGMMGGMGGMMGGGGRDANLKNLEPGQQVRQSPIVAIPIV